MLELAPVSLSDKEWVDKIVFAENSPSADFNFGNIFVWDKLYRQYIGKMNDRLIVRVGLSAQALWLRLWTPWISSQLSEDFLWLYTASLKNTKRSSRTAFPVNSGLSRTEIGSITFIPPKLWPLLKAKSSMVNATT